MVRRRFILRPAGVDVRRDRHRRQRDALLHPQRVAAELELASELRELRTEAADVASRAIAACLLRERGNRGCWPLKEQGCSKENCARNKRPPGCATEFRHALPPVARTTAQPLA